MSDANVSTEHLPMHHAKAAFGGAVCCSVTLYGTTPVDFFKTQIHKKPVKYTSFFSADKNTISDVSGALTTGRTPTSQSYFVQGWSKFDGVKICKTRFEMGMNEQDARKNREFNTLGGPAVAEFVADAFLYPFEACHTRSVSDPSNAKVMLASGQKLVAQNGGSSPISRMNKMLRFALSQWNNGCKSRWIHRTTTTMRWREVWTRTTLRILPIRRLSDHACFEIQILLSACVNTDSARCVFKWMMSNTILTRDCEGPVFMVVFLPDPCIAGPRAKSAPPYKWQIRTAY